jgi:hypothetical protein
MALSGTDDPSTAPSGTEARQDAREAWLELAEAGSDRGLAKLASAARGGSSSERFEPAPAPADPAARPESTV